MPVVVTATVMITTITELPLMPHRHFAAVVISVGPCNCRRRRRRRAIQPQLAAIENVTAEPSWACSVKKPTSQDVKKAGARVRVRV